MDEEALGMGESVDLNHFSHGVHGSSPAVMGVFEANQSCDGEVVIIGSDRLLDLRRIKNPTEANETLELDT
jgi:hypothetical protein